MTPDKAHDGDQPSLIGPGPTISSTMFQPSPKLRDKMNKLAKWRIDPAAIEFLQDTPECNGGFATVSQALLVTTSGKVVKGRNKADGRSPTQRAVAVKKLKVAKEKDLERVLKLGLREAGIVAELSHTNIVRFEGFVEDVSQSKIWLVFPWAENGNLRDFVASADWEIPERISLINDVARGVEYLHSRDRPICHGDLKSINVLVNSELHAVIIDFGSARRLSETVPETQPQPTDDAADPGMVLKATVCASTNTITLTGNQYTLRWAAPEVLNDEEPCLASDLWALGWIFYEVMTNKIPFEGIKSESAIIKNVICGELPSVTEDARMSLIRKLCSVMIECWSIDPCKRPTAESCRKLISWMPMIKPNPQRSSESTVSNARSPALLMELGRMHKSQNDYVNASKFYTEALDICPDSDRRGKAKAMLGLADVHRAQNKLNEAAVLHSQALQICTDLDDGEWKAKALFGLAEVNRAQGNHSTAVTLYSQSLQIRTETGDRQGRAATLLGLGNVHRLQRKYNKAAIFYSEAAEICADTGNRYGRASALWGLAEVHRLRKEYNDAFTLFSEALQIRTEIGDRYGSAYSLRCLADLHRDQEHHTDAISLYEQAAGIFQQIGNNNDATRALRNAARVRRRLKRTSPD